MREGNLESCVDYFVKQIGAESKEKNETFGKNLSHTST